MKKIISILFFLIIASCCKCDEGVEEEMYSLTYYIELDNVVTERLIINQISLPGYVFYPTSQQQTFTLDNGMSGGLNDVRVTLSGKCSVQNRDVNVEVFVNFLENKPTVVFSISTVNTCSPVIVTTYK